MTTPFVFPRDFGAMREQLHLIDNAGVDVRGSIQSAVEHAFRWILRSYPLVDPALIANWAEELACSMEAGAIDLRNPRRYASAALEGKVKDWLKTGAAKLQPMGVGSDLERFGGVNGSTQSVLDQSLLIEQVTTTLNERDRFILVLLLDGCTDTEIASALKISPSAGRKAIQRMRERSAASLQGSRRTKQSGHGPPALCETKG